MQNPVQAFPELSQILAKPSQIPFQIDPKSIQKASWSPSRANAYKKLGFERPKNGQEHPEEAQDCPSFERILGRFALFTHKWGFESFALLFENRIDRIDRIDRTLSISIESMEGHHDEGDVLIDAYLECPLEFILSFVMSP